MANLNGCQIPCLPKISEGIGDDEHIPSKIWIKRRLAKTWNYQVKKKIKLVIRLLSKITTLKSLPQSTKITKIEPLSDMRLASGDQVKVRSKEEIQATLDTFKELRGCAFLSDMWQYCGTYQKVLQPMERFLDERDYKVKKCKGIILLEGVMCQGTPVFGRCDRRCHFFWREEWLEKISQSNALEIDR